MSDHKALPWGEKHLYGQFYTVKIKIGLELRHAIGNKFDALKDICLWDAGSDKKGRQYFMIAAVLIWNDFIKYRLIKEEAQLQVLVNTMRTKAKTVKDLKDDYKRITTASEISRSSIEC